MILTQKLLPVFVFQAVQGSLSVLLLPVRFSFESEGLLL